MGLLCLALPDRTAAQEQINGVNFVSPKVPTKDNYTASVKRINANWIAITPFAFLTPGDPKVRYNTSKNWWGDTPPGITNTIRDARQNGLKVFIKPHFWVSNQGWPGDYDLSDSDWKTWEINYEIFMMQMARIAESNDVEMICIGTEFKIAIRKRRRFFEELIRKLRKVYSGKITYAANWDNFKYVTFWDQLDYIGVDAYFPLSSDATPNKEDLQAKWNPFVKEMAAAAETHQKQVIFTEFGYRSTDGTAWKQWEIEGRSSDEKVNLEAQIIAYEALFEATWKQKWLAGGFIWKWWNEAEEKGGENHSNYTPQNKPVEAVIQKWYTP